MTVFSVIIAAYNAGSYVQNAIRSVQAQTFGDWELIVADDASTDDTVAQSRSLADADGRISVIALTENGGPSIARNAAIAAAKGEWLVVLDADDRFTAGRLENLARYIHADADILCDQLLMWDLEAAVVSSQRPGPLVAPGPVTFRDLIASDGPGSRFKLGFLKPAIRAEFLRRSGIRYEPDIRLAEDFMLLAECLAQGACFRLLAEPGYLYTTQVGEVSGKRSNQTNTQYDPSLRRLVGARLHDRYARSLSPTDLAILSQYRRWQDIYTRVMEMAAARHSRRWRRFARLALSDPAAIHAYIRDSGPGRRITKLLRFGRKNAR